MIPKPPEGSEARPPASLRAALARFDLGNQRVLEPACGRARYLRHFGPGSRGIDRSSAVCAATNQELAARGVDRAVVTADLDVPGWSATLKQLPSFEAAFLCDVLMHVKSPATFLAELAELLPSGTPILSVEWTLPRGRLSAALARRLPGAAEVFDAGEHLRTFRSDELVERFHAAGFLIEDSWIHSFEGRPAKKLLSNLVAPFWPVHTRLFRGTL